MLVLDACAAVDLVVPTPRTQTLQQVVQGERLYAPHLLYSESLSALWRMERTHGLTQNQAEAAMSLLRAMPIRTAWAADWVEAAWSRREWLRVTDAVYVAASQALNAPLLTTDKRLARALSDRSIAVVTV